MGSIIIVSHSQFGKTFKSKVVYSFFKESSKNIAYKVKV